MPLYFAYGSNMDLSAMAERCPASKPCGTARLMRHRLQVFDGGYATVVRDPQRAVWGRLWDLALADIPALDRYESLHSGLYTKVTQPVLTAHGPRRAVVYVARSAKPGIPKPGYMEGVVAAAEQAGLPADYLRGLRAFLHTPQARSRCAPDPLPRPAVRPLWSAPSGTLRRG